MRVGQKVRCVDANGLTEGAIYTIRWVGKYRLAPAVRLEEIPNRPPCVGTDFEVDLPFSAGRFRSIQKTDIGVFTDMLRSIRGFV